MGPPAVLSPADRIQPWPRCVSARADCRFHSAAPAWHQLCRIVTGLLLSGGRSWPSCLLPTVSLGARLRCGVTMKPSPPGPAGWSWVSAGHLLPPSPFPAGLPALCVPRADLCCPSVPQVLYSCGHASKSLCQLLAKGQQVPSSLARLVKGEVRPPCLTETPRGRIAGTAGLLPLSGSSLLLTPESTG